MPLTQSDIKVFKSSNISDTSSNGGDMTTLELFDVVGALFPNIDNTERLAGSTKWRKVFFKLHNDGLLPLISARLYQDQDTVGTDTILMAQAVSMNDTQNTLPASPKLYGSAPLRYSTALSATSVSVLLPQDITNFFTIGDSIRISNKNLVTGIGSEDFVAITDMTIVGSEVEMTVSPPLNTAYSSSDTRVMNIIEFGDLYAKVNNVAVTSASGTFDSTKIEMNNRSTVQATWTITFTSSTVFTVASTLLGTPANGNTGTQLVINNPSYSLPYLKVPTTAFGGNYLSGDTIILSTVPAAIPVWLKRIVPAGATPIAANRATYVLDGGTV